MKYKMLLVAIFASNFVFTTFAASEEVDPANSSSSPSTKLVKKIKKEKLQMILMNEIKLEDNLLLLQAVRQVL